MILKKNIISSIILYQIFIITILFFQTELDPILAGDLSIYLKRFDNYSEEFSLSLLENIFLIFKIFFLILMNF